MEFLIREADWCAKCGSPQSSSIDGRFVVQVIAMPQEDDLKGRRTVTGCVPLSL